MYVQRKDTAVSLLDADGKSGKGLILDSLGKLWVNIGAANAAAASAINLGVVSVDGITVTQSPTVDTDAYTAGDTVGDLMTFANAAKVTGGGGVIKNVMIVDDAGDDAETELWLFDTTYTPPADDAAWAPTEVDLHTLVAVISTKDSAQGWMSAGTPSVCDIEVARRYDCTGTSLFGSLVTRGTPNPDAADDITVRIMLLQD